MTSNNMFNILLDLLNTNNSETTYYVLCCIANIVSSGVKLMNQIVHVERLHKLLLSLLKKSDMKICNEVMAIYHTFTGKGNNYTMENVLKSECLYVIAELFEFPHTNLFMCNLIALLKALVINEFTESDVNYQKRIIKIFETGLKESLCRVTSLVSSNRILSDCNAIFDFYAYINNKLII
jgi:hypothetical protein